MSRILTNKYEKGSSILKNFNNPPIIWSLVSIGLACIPWVKSIVMPSQSFLEFLLIDSAISFGKAAPFVMLFNAGINLGWSLVQNPLKDSSDNDVKPMKKWKAVVLTGIRLLVMPCIGIGILYPLYRYGLIIDPILLLILLLQFTTPPCLNLLIICNQHHYCV
jgi:hypothetical protein